MSKKTILRACAFIAITALAFFLRAYRFNQVPLSLNSSEASIGWNAYSILKTGFDEQHRFLPLDTFKNMGEDGRPMVLYLTAASIWAFGLNDFAVRFPSILFGILTVLLVYFLTSTLLRLPEREKTDEVASASSRWDTNGMAMPALVALLLAISPAHIQLSRIALEQNIAFFFVVLGITILLSARTKPIRYSYGWLPFAAAIYCLRGAEVSVLILGLLIICFSISSVKQHLRIFLLGLLIAAFTLVPLLPHLFSQENLQGTQAESIFTLDSSLVQNSEVRMLADGKSFTGGILHSPAGVGGQEYLIQLFDYFQPNFLWVHGDENPIYSLWDVGEMYLIDVLFFAIGVYALFRHRPRQWCLLGLLLLGMLFPAAAVRGSPSALRMEDTLPLWQIFIAAGILYSLSWFRGPRRFLAWSVVVLVYGYSLGYFASNYFNHYPVEFSAEWQFGHKEAITYAEKYLASYDVIEVSDSSGEAYIFALLYGHYDPFVFWDTVKRSTDQDRRERVQGFGKYEFVFQYTPQRGSRVMYILPPDQVPVGAHVLQTIHQGDGTTALVIFE